MRKTLERVEKNEEGEEWEEDEWRGKREKRKRRGGTEEISREVEVIRKSRGGNRKGKEDV